MYLSDLSKYVDDLNLVNQSLQVVSVGWLEKGKAFNQGETSEQFKQRLLLFCSNPLWTSLGYHECDLCSNPIGNSSQFLIREDGTVYNLGSTEIMVPGKGNTMYVAPDLIYHYVCVHNYLPPPDFIQAVINSALPGSPEYARLTQHIEPHTQEVLKKGVLELLGENIIPQTRQFMIGKLLGFTGESDKLLIPVDILEPFPDVTALNGVRRGCQSGIIPARKPAFLTQNVVLLIGRTLPHSAPQPSHSDKLNAWLRFVKANKKLYP